MNIGSNFAVALALGDLNRNNKQINKMGKIASTGMLLNSAADGSSDYSISEKMQARIRCLNQDDQNVKTGTDLLQLAEGAIQSQINILKTVKAKVIEANNDTCTDSDRAIIQKEIDQAYEEIDDIAYETNYNGLRLLNGDFAKEKIGSWLTLDKSAKIKGSDSINLLLDDIIPTLDGIEGPFATFQKWTSGTSADVGIAPVSPIITETFTKGQPGDRTEYVLDLSGFSLDDLEGQGLCGLKATKTVKDTALAIDYVLTRKPEAEARKYGVTLIDYSGCASVDEVAKRIASIYNAGKEEKELFTAEAKGEKVVFTSLDDTNDAEFYAMSSKFYPGGISESCPKTGLFSTLYLNGGVNSSGKFGDDDSPLVDAERAELVFGDFKDAPAGSGITIHYGGYTVLLSFLDDDSELKVGDRQRKNIYGATIGKYCSTEQNVQLSKNEFLGGFDISYKDGVLTYKAPDNGTKYNNSSDYYIEDGIPGGEWLDIKQDLKGEFIQTGTAKTSDNPAYIVSALTAKLKEYSGTSDKDLEEFIDFFKNKRLCYSTGGGLNYEFIDGEKFESSEGKTYETYDSVRKNESARFADLNDFREKYKAGDYGSDSIGLAAAKFIKETFESGSIPNKYVEITESGSDLGMIKFKSDVTGDKGNGTTMNLEPTNLRSYRIHNFASIFERELEDGTKEEIPLDEVHENLNGQGFRAYCATDSNQWFNFVFTNGEIDPEMMSEKPKGDTGADIKSIYIDISNVTDVESLITTIYDQAEPKLETDPQLNHFMRLAIGHTKDLATGEEKADSLILYDKRNYAVGSPANYPWYQEDGAKIAEGSMDDVVWGERDLYVKRLVIHHTDRSSANIKLDIPNTDLKSIYGMDTDYEDLRRYNVLTKSNRKRLLGTKEKEGALDYGINYLTGAQTLIGAQVNHLKFANENITTQHQYTTAAESQIRDADMAHTMTEYAKANVLGQASQTMLAQANQNSSQVLSLLQG